MMYAVEFQAVVKDSYIHIPGHRELENKPVRVILLDASRENKKEIEPKDTIDTVFDRYRLDIGHMKFDRDEAHER